MSPKEFFSESFDSVIGSPTRLDELEFVGIERPVACDPPAHVFIYGNKVCICGQVTWRELAEWEQPEERQ